MMGPRIVLLVIAIALIAPVPVVALRFIARTKASSSSLSYVNFKRVSTMTLFDKSAKDLRRRVREKLPSTITLEIQSMRMSYKVKADLASTCWAFRLMQIL